jgi:hypothetical protein
MNSKLFRLIKNAKAFGLVCFINFSAHIFALFEFRSAFFHFFSPVELMHLLMMTAQFGQY